jgi:hypothetical protein
MRFERAQSLKFWSWRIAALAIASIALAQPPQAALPRLKLPEPSRGLSIVGFEADRTVPAKWERGFLLSYDFDKSIVLAADRSGQALRAQISPPEASHVFLRDVSVSPSGTFAVAFSAISSQGPAGFIAWLDHSGSIGQLVQIASGSAELIRFADDGSLWAAVRTGPAFGPESDSYDILRHYDAKGKLIGSALPRRLFPPGPFPGELGSLTASRDRIGFFDRHTRTWVEFDYAGKTLGRWVLPGPKVRHAWALLSQSNDVYIGQQESIDKSEIVKTYRFDKSSNTLQEFDVSGINAGHPASLAGVDGEELVFLVSYHPPLLKWSTHRNSSRSAGATPW